MNKILLTIILSIFISFLLFLVKNKSNFPKQYIIPFITAMLIKYIQGDWDKNYTWSNLDIVYLLTIFLVSYITILLFQILI